MIDIGGSKGFRNYAYHRYDKMGLDLLRKASSIIVATYLTNKRSTFPLRDGGVFGDMTWVVIRSFIESLGDQSSYPI